MPDPHLRPRIISRAELPAGWTDGRVRGLRNAVEPATVTTMDNFFSNEPFVIPCPSCKKEINKPLSWFKKDIVSCPHCKATIHTRKFRKELETAENNSLKFRKKL
jgi:hypothetical protein